MKESKFQHELIKEIKERFPGAMVLKNDPNYIQGIPDLSIFYENKWATLECKNSPHANHQPNQDYYVEKMNSMSFSSFVDPQSRGEVLDELEKVFRSRR